MVKDVTVAPTLALVISCEIVYSEPSTGQCRVAVSLDVFIFLSCSMKYTQCTMDEAQRRIKLMQTDLGGTEILTQLRNQTCLLYTSPSPRDS